MINLFNSRVGLDPPLKDSSVGSSDEMYSVRSRMEQQPPSKSDCDFAPPIISSLTGKPCAQTESIFSQCVVLGDSTGTTVATVERDGSTFKIFSVGPSGRSPLAEIHQQRRNVLTVVMEEDSEPTYTIHKVFSHPFRRIPTKYVIKKQGIPVASSRYGEGNSYVLTISHGADACLMTCLAAVADEVHEKP